MGRLWLVRHGKAAAGFAEDLDPGLDNEGRRQADGLVAWFEAIGPLPMVVSPLRRARETARPLEEMWGVAGRLDERVAEIPSPTDDLEERAAWLRDAMAARWSVLPEPQRMWRVDLLEALGEIDGDTVIVTHFVAINAVLGEAAGDDRVVQEIVANGSVTTVDTDGGRFELVDVGVMGSADVR